MAKPYRTTPVFDQDSLPAALRQDHSTKAGVWGLIRVLGGRLLLTSDGGAKELAPGRPGAGPPGAEAPGGAARPDAHASRVLFEAATDG